MSAPKKYFDEVSRKEAIRRNGTKWRSNVANLEEFKSYNREYARLKHLRKTEELAGRAKPDVCEICGGGGKICFDHNHKTGKFRGWICQNCNTALGHARDNVETFQRLIAYLQADNLTSL